MPLYAFGLGFRLINLVDRHDDRHIRRFGVVNSFLGLRHHAVIRRHHQNHDIRHLRASRAHACERLMAWRIYKNHAAVVHHHLVRADVLRNSARFA